MATHSSVLAWRIPGMAEPGGLPSVGSHRDWHEWSNLAAADYWDKGGRLANSSFRLWLSWGEIEDQGHQGHGSTFAERCHPISQVLLLVLSPLCVRSSICLLQVSHPRDLRWPGQGEEEVICMRPHLLMGWRHEKAQDPPPAQEAEEPVSWEGPHRGLDDAAAWAPHYCSGQGRDSAPLGHLHTGSQGPCVHNNPCLSCSF